MAGGHNTHASGIAHRQGKRHTQSGNRASKWRSPDNFTTASLTHITKYDVNTVSTAPPTKEEIIRVRAPAQHQQSLLLQAPLAAFPWLTHPCTPTHPPPLSLPSPSQSMIFGKWASKE